MKLFYLLLVFLFLWGCDRSESIHKNCLVIDTHCDSPMLLVNDGLNLSERHSPPDVRVDFPRLREGNVDAIFFALFTGQRPRIPENCENAYRLAHQMLDSTRASVSRDPDRVALATRSSDVRDMEKQNKTAIFLGMENGFPLGLELSRVKEFYDCGVRYITLCHSSNNDLCDSSTDPAGPEHDGVSEFGEKVIEEMNRLGMIIDVSHISDASFYDVLRLSKAPVIASHSSARAVCNHPRNLDDDMIRTLAGKGGVIQICILGMYIREADTSSVNYREREKLRKKYNNWQYANEEERKRAWAEYDSINRIFPQTLPTVADAVDHIDHVVDLVGVDYVGIGSDFDGGGGLAGCADVSEFPQITRELIRRGYTAREIEKIWGGNFLRVFREVEAVSDKM
ncbi:MAG TPA: dipeptidase [Prolixibacteraceae bacterium]|nr:dipeptidase [Prolixibacteraceae bacterium]